MADVGCTGTVVLGVVKDGAEADEGSLAFGGLASIRNDGAGGCADFSVGLEVT